MKLNFRDRPALFSLIVLLGAVPLMWAFLTPIARLVPAGCGQAVKYLGTLLVGLGVCQECFGGIPFSLEKKGFWKGLLTAGIPGLLPPLAFLLLNRLSPAALPGLSLAGGFLASALAAAISEEFLFRGLFLTALRRKYSLWKSVLLCSLLFSLQQLFGLLWDFSAPGITLAQAALALLSGIYLCALAIRTGNLWVCTAVHFFGRLCTGLPRLLSPDFFACSTLSILAFTVLHLLLPLAAWLLLRKGSHK